MRRIYLLSLSLFLLVLFACKPVASEISTHPKENEQPAVIEFEELEHDFGIVNEGETVGWYFKYKNVGETDLLITNVRTSCGCTVPQYSKKPLAPGEQELMQIIFDSKGKSGKEIKNVTIESNAQNNSISLTLIFEVIN
ncbi:MAG: DUF1573 domain-containing protein [Bacteroidales bacterium]|nr:DUF1573 domain-containing protein [Bacteroidales bacterium]